MSAAAAAADNFSWLGGAPSVFRLAAAPNDFGWRRRRESAAEGSSSNYLLLFHLVWQCHSPNMGYAVHGQLWDLRVRERCWPKIL